MKILKLVHQYQVKSAMSIVDKESIRTFVLLGTHKEQYFIYICRYLLHQVIFEKKLNR
jgi:hypothetical protein